MPDDHSVFISYAHHDTSIDRIAGFSQFLYGCLPGKIEILLDRKYLGIGKNIPDYMDRLDSCPVAVVLLTPEYKRRADGATGGVFTEFAKIRKRYLDEDDDFLVLPILFEGTSSTSVPKLLVDEMYEDFCAFHPRKKSDEPIQYYLSDKQREQHIPKFTEIGRLIESRITVRASLPQEEFRQQLERLFAKTKITRKWVALYPEFINHLFVPTHSYNRVKTQDAVFLIGRKGSGKSTLANTLPELEHITYKTSIPITADHINLLSTYEFLDKDNLSNSFDRLAQRLGGSAREYMQLNPAQLLFKYSWLGLLYISLARQLCRLAEDGEMNENQMQFTDSLQNEFDRFTFRQSDNVDTSAYFTTASVSFSEFWEETIDSALAQERFSDVVRYLDSHVNPENYLSHLLSPKLLDVIRQVVQFCDRRALVTLDDFDAVFSMFREGLADMYGNKDSGNTPQSVEAAWVQALMLLILELKEYRKGWRDEVFDKLDFCITIPRDSYLQVLYSDRDAYHELECSADLDWTGVYLAKMLLRRLCYMYGEDYNDDDDVFAELERLTRTYIKKLPNTLSFDFNSNRISIELFCYVLRHTFWRPRDILTYYAALMTASLSCQDQRRLSVEQVRRIIGVTTKRILRFEFVGEFSGTIGNLGKILNTFRRAPQVLTHSNLYDRLKDMTFQVAPHGQISKFDDKLRILYEIGFLGLRLPKDVADDEGLISRECFYFNEGSAVFDSMMDFRYEGCDFMVHPSFVETLHLRHSENDFILHWDRKYLRDNHVIRVAGLDAM